MYFRYLESEVVNAFAERYHILPNIALKMGLNTDENINWRDLCLAELSIAVLYSYGKEGLLMFFSTCILLEF
jgi:nitric oxide synthase oxygenase domain/subunit